MHIKKAASHEQAAAYFCSVWCRLFFVFNLFFSSFVSILLTANSLFEIFNALPETLADVRELARAENYKHDDKK